MDLPILSFFVLVGLGLQHRRPQQGSLHSLRSETMVLFNSAAVKTVLFLSSFEAAFKHLPKVSAQRRRFPVLEPRHRGLAPVDTCESAEHICDWDDASTPKHAVCTTKGDTMCVDADQTTLLASFGSGKGDFFTVASCGCCDVEDEFFCENLPLQEPDCAALGGFSCDPDYPEKVQFCCNSLSKSGKKTKLESDCGDPYAKPDYEKGDTFAGCGESCDGSASPSETPSEQPSSQPTDSCLVCQEDPEFVYSALPMTFSAHKQYARFLGCSLASVNSVAEQTAVYELITSLDLDVREDAMSAFLGAMATSMTDWMWVDGSGSFNSLASPYFGFFASGEPDPASLDFAIAISLVTDGVSTGSWFDVSKSSTLPAIYTCCKELGLGQGTDNDEYASCEVPTETTTTCPAFTQTGYNTGSECGAGAPVGTVCSSPSCAPNYSGIPQGSATCGSDGNWVGNFSGCTLTICIPGDSPIERLTNSVTREYETINVSELRIGDYVRCFDQISNTIDFCKVYYHNHRRDIPNTQYLKFTYTSSGATSMTLSPDNFRASLTHFQYLADPSLSLGTTFDSALPAVTATNFKQARHVEVGDKMLVWIADLEVLRVEEVTNIEQITREDAFAPSVANGDTLIAGGALLSAVSAPNRFPNILEPIGSTDRFSTYPILRGAWGALLWYMPDADFQALPTYGLTRDDPAFQSSPVPGEIEQVLRAVGLGRACNYNIDILGFQEEVFNIVESGTPPTLSLNDIGAIFLNYVCP